jgi:hypothetical protein
MRRPTSRLVNARRRHVLRIWLLKSSLDESFLFSRLKLCPKDVRNIETYLKISNSIEIQEPLKTRVLQRISIVFYALRFFAASYTRVKSQVQVLYRPPLLLKNVAPVVLKERRIYFGAWLNFSGV